MMKNKQDLSRRDFIRNSVTLCGDKCTKIC